MDLAAESPWDNPHSAWDLEERFRRVEAELFVALVLHPAALTGPPYGTEPQPIRVRSSVSAPFPVMLSNGPGKWDHPIREGPDDADLRFESFFDWSNIDRRDNRYVMAQVAAWPGHDELIGKSLLIESHHCRYETAAGKPDG